MTEERKKTDLKISGMMCSTCSTTIKKSLLSQDGVADARVNLGNETAMVEYDTTKVKLTDLEKAVTDAGYGVINEKVTLKIGGVTCAMCVKTIEGSLNRLDGIADVIVNLGVEKAYVAYNPGAQMNAM
jgi:Cu+-exporting ATPase